jgi:hypothetical protein
VPRGNEDFFAVRVGASATDCATADADDFANASTGKSENTSAEKTIADSTTVGSFSLPMGVMLGPAVVDNGGASAGFVLILPNASELSKAASFVSRSIDASESECCWCDVVATFGISMVVAFNVESAVTLLLAIDCASAIAHAPHCWAKAAPPSALTFRAVSARAAAARFRATSAAAADGCTDRTSSMMRLAAATARLSSGISAVLAGLQGVGSELLVPGLSSTLLVFGCEALIGSLLWSS